MKTKILRFGESRRPPFRYWYDTPTGREMTDEKTIDKIFLFWEQRHDRSRKDDDSDLIYDLVNPLEIYL